MCDNCERSILPGDGFRQIVGTHEDGKMFSLKLCANCAPAPAQEESGGEDLVPEFPSMYELTQEIHEAKSGSRCVVCDEEVRLGQHVRRVRDLGTNAQEWVLCFDCLDELHRLKEMLLKKESDE